MNFNNLRFNSCDFLCAYDVISYDNQNELVVFVPTECFPVMPGSCRVKSDSVWLFVCAFTVLPAWWMETVPWEENPDILHSGADRHRLRTTLLLLSDLLWGRGQPAGEIKAMFLLQGLFTFTFMHLVDAFIQSNVYSGYTFFVSMCVPWELNPQPFVLIMQCSTTEPQEHWVFRCSGYLDMAIPMLFGYTYRCKTSFKTVKLLQNK